MRKCARAIIFDEQNRLLVFARQRQTHILGKVLRYYSIPGGGMESGETPEQTVVRELYEEMLIDIEPLSLIAHQIDEDGQREQFYYLARIVSGTPRFNEQSEEATRRLPMRKSTYEIMWAELDDPKLQYYAAYGQIADQMKIWLENDTFPAEPVDMHVKSR